MTATAPVILSAVTKHYGAVHAVSGVDLALQAGECVALVGHNGAGKSTLIKLMLGLIQPTSGTVSVFGGDPATDAGARARRDVGYLPENLALYPTMTGTETLAFYARLKRQPTAGNKAILERVGIAQAARRRVGTYSKGMRQRLGLAQALLGEPRILLLDEPTTGLDPALRLSFYEILRELRGRGTALLLSSHALAELEGQVDRVVIMNQGRKVADGTMADLRRSVDLPVRIRLRLAQDLRVAVNASSGALDGWSHVGEKTFELRCTEREKAGAIQSAAALPVEILEIEIFQPSLDDMYAHFLRREGG